MAEEDSERGEGTGTLKALHYKRGQCSSKITRIATKLDALNGDTPDHWYAYELREYEETIAAQRKIREGIQDEIIESFTLSTKETDDEEKAQEKFDDAARKSIFELARMKKVSHAHREYRQLLEEIKDYDATASSRQLIKHFNRCEEHFNTLRKRDALDADTGGHLTALHKSAKADMRELSDAADKAVEADEATRPATAEATPADALESRRSDHRSSTRLPRIQIPTFKGNCMEWPSFWDIFNRAVCTNKELAEDEKMSYLSQAIQDPNYPQAVDSSSTAAGRFGDTVKQLIARYDRKRKRHSKFTADLFACPKCPSTSGPDLHKLHTRLSGAVRNLEATGQFTARQLATAHTETLLPDALAREWHLKENNSQIVPDIGKLLAMIEEHSNLPSNQPDAISSHKPRPERQPERKPDADRGRKDERSKRQNYLTSTGKQCSLCKEDAHPLYFCEKFKALTVADRTELVKEKRLCFNCLTPGHTTRDCSSTYRCKTCGKPHHTLLHREYRQRKEEDTTITAAASVVSGKVKSPGIFIPTLQLIAQSPTNKEIPVRAMMDNGSTISLIKASVVQKLGLKKHTKNAITMIGARGTALGTAKSLVRFVLQSKQVPGSQLDMTAYVVEEVASDLPEKKVDNTWKFLDDVTLGDPAFNVPSKVDLLLGNDILDDIVQMGILRGTEDFPRATKTIFGWVVEGRMEERELPAGDKDETAFCATICKLSAAEELLAKHQETDSLLRSFWEVEEVQREKPAWTPEEEHAMNHFNDTHIITKEGRYQVTLPRRATAKQLGSSRGRALKRFEANEASLIRRGRWSQFQDVVTEYLKLDHAEQVPAGELQLPPQESYYMPMHAVLKATSTTTKLRVVFDASAATTSGTSFNETLAVGPTVQKTLTEILLKFRTHRVAVSADISKMYRAIELTPPDRNFHRFLWRRNLADPVTDFRMRRVTFGVAASPFVATRVLMEVADRARQENPEAAGSISDCFYVDDYLSGANTYEDASKMCRQVMTLLDSHGLTLRKWRSSSAGFLGTIPPELREIDESTEAYGPGSYLKTLGIHWDASADHFFVSTSELSLPKTLTKRLLSSDIHRTFDVLGWLTPVTLLMKILLQELWEEKLAWDEQVSSRTQAAWTEWRNELPELAAIPIPRYYYRKDSNPRNLHLHGFADASMKAYAAVVYLRAEYEDRPPTVTLVTSKSRVAPLKPLSVPKLELCAAQLLGELMRVVMITLSVSISDVTCWTDSTIVLNWLDGSARRYRTYVANRIVRTLELIPVGRWKHVPTTSNPADCASRGLLPIALISHALWWTGPTWLHSDPVTIPPQPINQQEELEQKTVAVTTAQTQPPPWLVDRWSSHTRLRRITGWICRFARQIRPGQRRKMENTLAVQELEEADRVLLRAAQERTFGTGRNKGADSKELEAFCPYMDKERLIRIGGRLGNAEVSQSQQHPVILHSRDPLVKLMIVQCHLDTGHAGPSLMLAKLGQQFHIIGAIRQIKHCCNQCVTCRRIRAQPGEQLMGQLPAHRVNPGRVFEVVGLDYAGPILTRYAHIRKPVFVKSYVCVFICMATRAIHLEVVSNLTTEAFIACLQRFVSRRGRPSIIYSDNGSNFVGAARQLEEALLPTPAAKQTLATHCANKGITWKFSPDRAPHFGGMWEAGVKSMKHHLRRIMGDHKLTFEELTTVLAQIEAMLNGRPLVRIHAHNEEGIEVLTPGHFLIGRPMEALPSRQPHKDTSLTKRWNLCQELTNHFWTRWSEEYLRQLQRRDKWRTARPNFKVNDIVLLKEDGLVKPDWPLAKVVETFPGKDGLVRVVQVKAKNSTFKRPVAKLVMILPSDVDSKDKEKSSSLFGAGMTESGSQPLQVATPPEEVLTESGSQSTQQEAAEGDAQVEGIPYTGTNSGSAARALSIETSH